MIKYLETGLKLETETRHLAHLLSLHAPSMPEGELNQLATILSDLLHTIPENIRLINAYQAHPRCRKPLAFAFGEILRYCFDEDDLLPERQFGVLGLIDDAYLLYAFTNLLPVYFPFAVSKEMLGPDFNSREIVDKLLPVGMLDAMDNTVRSVLEISIALFSGGIMEENSGSETIKLNIERAIASFRG